MDTLSFDLGAVFDVSEAFSITADLVYEKWDDEEYYLTDDTGDFFMGMIGFLFTF